MNKPSAARNLAASDVKNDSGFHWLLITGTSGSVVLDQVGGNQVTLAVVPAAVWIPVGNCTNIRTSSTATGFMVA